jgi:hypothetical protein
MCKHFMGIRQSLSFHQRLAKQERASFASSSRGMAVPSMTMIRKSHRLLLQVPKFSIASGKDQRIGSAKGCGSVWTCSDQRWLV